MQTVNCMTVRELVAICIVIAVAACGLGNTRAEAAVYWGYGSTVGKAELDGRDPHYDLLPSNESRGYVCGVAVNERQLFWANFPFGIGMTDLETRVSDSAFIGGNWAFAGGVVYPCGLAANSSHIFWGNPYEGGLGRAGVDGGEVNPAFIGGGIRPCAVALHGEYVYWADQFTGRIGRAKIDGSGVDPTFSTPGAVDCGLAVDDHFAYWAEAGFDGASSGAIGRTPLDGGESERGFIAGIGEASGIAANSTHIYWTEQSPGGYAGTGAVGRANLDGTAINRGLIPTPRSEISGIAVDGRPGSLPQTERSRPIRFGKVRHVPRSGAVFLSVLLPTGGRLKLNGPPVRWKVIKSGAKAPEGPLRLQLKLWPGDFDSSARGVRSRLMRRGRAPVSLLVVYREPGHWPIFATKRVTLVLEKASRVRR